MSDSGGDPRPIGLYLLARASAIPALTPGEVLPDVVLREGDARGNTFDERGQSRPV